MPLKDYTTEKTPEQTISDIQRLLKDFGIRSVMTDYDDAGNIVSMSFFMVFDGRGVDYRLPTDWRPVLTVMENDRNTERRYCKEDQARRTAWRLVYHWIEAQLALVRVNMVKIQTIFLPYMKTESGQTLHEMFDQRPDSLFLLK